MQKRPRGFWLRRATACKYGTCPWALQCPSLCRCPLPRLPLSPATFSINLAFLIPTVGFSSAILPLDSWLLHLSLPFLFLQGFTRNKNRKLHREKKRPLQLKGSKVSLLDGKKSTTTN